MYRGYRVVVCLPCRNEVHNLAAVVESLPGFVDEIIVMSNRSTDATVAVASQMGLMVVEENRAIGGVGYGFAHMAGIAAAHGDIIVGADCDGTYPLEALPEILDYLIDGGLDFVSCNRYPLQAGTRIPLALRLGVGCLNAEVRLLYGLKINDILSGMWVFRAAIKTKLNLTMGDWNLSPQIKLNAALHPAVKFAEYSITQHVRSGKSHQRYLKTGLNHAKWMLINRLAAHPPAAVGAESGVATEI